MKQEVKQEDSSNTNEEGRPRRSRRPEHQLGDRLCCDCKKTSTTRAL